MGVAHVCCPNSVYCEANGPSYAIKLRYPLRNPETVAVYETVTTGKQ